MIGDCGMLTQARIFKLLAAPEVQSNTNSALIDISGHLKELPGRYYRQLDEQLLSLLDC